MKRSAIPALLLVAMLAACGSVAKTPEGKLAQAVTVANVALEEVYNLYVAGVLPGDDLRAAQEAVRWLDVVFKSWREAIRKQDATASQRWEAAASTAIDKILTILERHKEMKA